MDYFSSLSEKEIKYNLKKLKEYESKKEIKEIIEIEDDVTIDDFKKIDCIEYDLFKIGFEQLNNFQKPIIKECIEKKYGGLSLSVGSGKTIISIVISLYLSMNKPILIIVSKSLISSWEDEIEKFYGTQLKYKVLNHDISKWKLKPKTKIILTTIDVLSKYYKENQIDKMFVKQRYQPRSINYINHYENPKEPYLNHIIGGGLFYSINWGCLIVDEAQTYTNIDTLRCQSLGALVCEHRWLLSGTLFNEPKHERILGYHVMLNVPDKPRNLPETRELLTSNKNFKGLNEHLIYRKSNLAFTPPIIHDKIITHVLLPEEVKIYTMMKQILIEIKKKADKAKLLKNVEESKKFSSYKLVMIMYLRQALICPLIPITSIIIDAADLEKRSELSNIIKIELKKLNIEDYLNNVKSIESTRIKATIDILKKHKNERVILFSCFRTYLDIMAYLLKDMKIFELKSELSTKARGNLIDEFRKSKSGVLMMTYDLGSTGLNLQCATTALFNDFYWNAATVHQGIGRLVRYGQLSSEVNLYFFTANTGIESIIFEKQKVKLHILEELKTGTSQTKIPKIRIDDVIKMIELEDNRKKLEAIEYIK